MARAERRKCRERPRWKSEHCRKMLQPGNRHTSFVVTTQVDRLKAFSLQPAINGFISA